MKTISIDARAMVGKESFHNAFASTLGFPSWYGRNMDAWIDCMSSLDDASDGLSEVTVSSGEVLVLTLENAGDFKLRCPELWQELLECVAFVNWRRMKQGQAAVLTISAYA